MELQELGNMLNNEADINSRNIGEITLRDYNRPDVFSDIKKRLKWILLIFTCVTLIFAPYFINHQKSDFITLFLYFILSIETIISIIALRQIRAIEHSKGNITQNLSYRIHHLQLIFKSYIFLNSFLYILLFAFLEYSMLNHLNPNFEGFMRVPLSFRLTLYTLFIIFQYYIKQRSFQKNYSTYLNKMISILQQTHD